MSEFDSLRLSPYYLNSRRLYTLGRAELPMVAQTSLAQNSNVRVEAMHRVSNFAEQLLRSGRLPNLTAAFPSNSLESERSLGSIWGVFTFRGASQAIRLEQEGKPIKNATFSGTIPLGDQEFEVHGELYNDHFFSMSSLTMLTGKRRMLIAGQFQFEGKKIQAFPYVIGELAMETEFSPMSWSSSIRIYPGSFDAFQAIQGLTTTKRDLEIIQLIPEDKIKNVFAELIGEPFVPCDWGGRKV